MNLRHLLAATAAACAMLAGPAFAQPYIVQAERSAPITTASAATTELVAAVTGQQTIVTHFDFLSVGTTNVTLVYGTGSNCATGTTSLTGAYNLTAQSGMSVGNGTGIIIPVPAGKALCITNSQAIQVSGLVSYLQRNP